MIGRYLLLTFIFLLYTLPALAVSLRQEAVVTDSVIRLQDLFYGLDESKDQILGAAPRPGQTLTLSARTLQRVAVATDLAWRPTSSADFLIVRRSATIVDQHMIEQALRDRFAAKYPALDLYNMVIVSGDKEIILPADMAAGAEVSSLRYDGEARWFQAEMVSPSLQNPHMRVKVSGKIEPLTEVPVLKSTLRQGHVIRAHDISVLAMPAHSLNHDTLLDAQDLIGLTPRRMVQAGRPLTENDLQEPLLVNKGKPVTMVYEQNGLRLTVVGRALQSGARGELIRVTNGQSSRTVDAVVSSADEVTVQIF